MKIAILDGAVPEDGYLLKLDELDYVIDFKQIEKWVSENEVTHIVGPDGILTVARWLEFESGYVSV